MRKHFLVLAVSIVISLFGCQTLPTRTIVGDVGRSVVVGGVSALPSVTSPALDNLGARVYPNTIVVDDNTPFYFVLYAFNLEIARFGPRDVVNATYGFKHWEPLNAQVPLLAYAYTDPEFKNCFGLAKRVVSMSRYNTAPETWSITRGEIRNFDGQYSYNYGYGGDAYPEPEREAKLHEVNIPRIFWNRTAVVQAANGTFYDMDVYVNGRFNGRIVPGQFYYNEFKNVDVSGRSVGIVVKMIFSDQGRREGEQEYRFWVPNEGIIAHQLTPGPFDIRR